MNNQADSKHINVSFTVNDLVFLRLQPLQQVSLYRQPTHKLPKWFFLPIQILEKIGLVAYRLILPLAAQLHDVFMSPSLNAVLATTPPPRSAITTPDMLS